MPKTRKISEFRTSAGNIFQKWRTSSGRIVYRKCGRFTSSRAFNAAKQFRTTPLETERTINVQDLADDKLQQEIAYEDEEGRFRAGEDAADYIPGLEPGEFIDRDTLIQLRRIRGHERNFIAFSRLDRYFGRPRNEIVDAYNSFLDDLRGVSENEKIQVLKNWGWSY